MNFEIFNEFFDATICYGANYVIKRYINWPLDKPLPIAIQHSYCYDINEGGQTEHIKSNHLLDFWLYGDREYYCHIHNNRLKKENAWRLGCPVCYLPKVKNKNTRKTIALPSHSAMAIKVSSFKEYCVSLSGLPDKYHPIDVCLHANDQYDEKIDGISFVRIGDKSDSNFLSNMIELFSNYTYLTTNYTGMPLWIGLYGGCSVFYYGKNIMKRADGTLFSKPQYYADIFTEKTSNLFYEDKMKLMNFSLGVNYVRNIDDLSTLMSVLSNTQRYQHYIGLIEKFGLQYVLAWIKLPNRLYYSLLSYNIITKNGNKVVNIIIKNGNTLWSLFGYAWPHVYQLDINNEFREINPDPNNLSPGSHLYYPLKPYEIQLN